MATLAEHPAVVPQSINGVYEPDMDSFLNLDQFTYTSAEPSRAKAALPSQPSVAGTDFSGATDMRSASFASSSQSPIAFQAPSHQYDEHKQQTGLPPGGLAHAMTFNNHVNGMGFGAGNQGFAMNGDMFAGSQMKREDASLDFNTVPTRNPSDMDLESDNMGAVPGYFFSPNANKSQYIDPNALGGQEAPMGPSTQVGRMYPGMHQQQAAMAKAAQQQKQQEFIRQQQIQQHQRRMEEHAQQNGTPQPQAPRVPNPVVEERISRLLQQMRQNAMGSPDGSPSPSMPQMAKAKKEEQDMDEDERLLASEEGKKLSSKERRQLRNKVSARAFRSRRKEYIGQLESEVAARTNEAHNLRMQNRSLYEENNRLTDLAHMLLSSPQFSSFMDDMNANGGLPSSNQSQAQPQQQPQQPQPQHQQAIAQPHMQANVAKDPPSHAHQEFQMQQTPQVGMGMVPNQGMDVPAMGFNAGWNSGIEMNYGNTPVFAVTEVPQGPVLDAEVLSGKSSSFTGSFLPETSKNEVPALELPTMAEEQSDFGVENSEVEIDESDPAFALFVESPATNESSGEQFEGVSFEKVSAFELVVENESQNKVNRLACLCDSMEAAFQPPRLPYPHHHSQNNYIVYDPSSYKLSGFDPPSTPPTGAHPMKFHYQVVTTPTADTPGTTLVLHFPDKRYFFGQLSEGTQRACTERGVKLTSLTDIFISGRTEWANNGGLIGMILTQADGLISANTALENAAREKQANRAPDQTQPKKDTKHGEPYGVQDGQLVPQKGHLTIHGGRNITHTLATARRFVFRKGMPVYTREYDGESMAKQASAAVESGDPFEKPTFSDSNIKVWAMPVSPSPSREAKVPSRSRTQSPRKRSLDEFQERNAPEESLDQQTKDQLMRQSVVSDMFNSSWRMDALIETRLADVKMPAAMFIRNTETKQLEQYTGPAPGSTEPLPDIKVLVRQPWPGASVEKLPPTTRNEEALSYIVRSHDIRGKFDPKKAQELKVRKGPDFARLTKGDSVESEDGKTITPDMVLGPTRLGKGVAVIDLPAPEYVENLVNRPEWKSPAVMTEMGAFVWILGPGVGEHPKLREFVASMPHCKHTVSGTDYCPNYLALNSVAGSSIRLARLKGSGYSVPVHDNVTLPQPGTLTAGSNITKEAIKTSPFEPVDPGLIIDIEPKFEFNRTDVVPRLNAHDTVDRIPFAVEQRMSAIRKRVQKPQFKEKLESLRQGLPGGDAEIITLGTGSSSPSKYRNVSSTLVHVPGYGYYLLDCGECTLGQLKRVYEPEQLREVLQNLRMIWISHLHADHHLGTVSLIRAWYHENYGTGASPSQTVENDMAKILQEKRLAVVSEEMMIGWLEEYAAVENYGFDKLVPLSANPYFRDGKIQTQFTYHHCRGDGTYPGHEKDGSKPTSTPLRFDDNSSPLTALLRSATGLSDLLTTRVSHCRGAMAVALVFSNGFKISFSGDCRPSEGFATIGHGSTVMIHEATFQNDMAVSAIAKRHSTTAEALEVGRKMEARNILLTHFSQRYQKVAHIDQRPESGPSKRGPETVKVPAYQQQPDIPVDEAEDATPPSKDEIKIPTASLQSKPRVPTTAAFDYMRIRVRDFPIAEAFAPALEKLFEKLERASAEESTKNRQEKNEELQAQKVKKHGKHFAARKPVAAPAPAPANPEAMDVDKKESSPKKQTASIWSASESESGWNTSGSDSEGDRAVQRRHAARKQTGSPRRASPRNKSKQ
ncbi:hypothetical protein ASPWEDRAFT_111904 [Aspergillus wentii DTO 134E9]|uniref:ribonuclease Z n=1 Tax=Aspergillus wentii DTO 134E9 TaxID=1073089 RepID=A0A1L9RIQ6_ASPWE|nr:uncharacterized protein ASPWEDRAFT_111904 [Aspergillus wentii DTO 134E9]OJJ34805.1 hypothetical protein ASPWEDRAFT_111904 [Aspergillus wentii DTO 134E9]